jgi:hypothetical protein
VSQLPLLAVVPCGKSKSWDREPAQGPTTAAETYTGTPFRLNRQYAERFSDVWGVLSAKYGFIVSDFSIPGPLQAPSNTGFAEMP